MHEYNYYSYSKPALIYISVACMMGVYFILLSPASLS